MSHIYTSFPLLYINFGYRFRIVKRGNPGASPLDKPGALRRPQTPGLLDPLEKKARSVPGYKYKNVYLITCS